MKLRELTSSEVELIVPVASQFPDQTGRHDLFRFREEPFVQTWRKLIDADVGVIFAAFEGSQCVGMLQAMIAPSDHDGALVAMESTWFVDPSVRKAGVGRLLLESFESWAKARGCERVIMGDLLHGTPSLDGFYRTHGYEPIEIHYQKSL